MKKKLTNGEKRECRLRYLYRQLKRAGKIKKDTPMKACRGDLEKQITLQEKKPRKKRVSKQPTKKQRRKTRKSLKAKFTQATQIAKKARRVARGLTRELKERLDPFKRYSRKQKKLYYKKNLKLTPAEMQLVRDLQKERDHGQAKEKVQSSK